MPSAAESPNALEVSRPLAGPLWHSLIFRVGVAMAGIALLAIGSMLTSIVIADISRGDAAAVNLAGSLRMRVYHMASVLQRLDGRSPQLDEIVRGFEQALYSETITRLIPVSASDPLQRQYQLATEQWQLQIRPALVQRRDPAQADSFVATLDRMVTLIQQQAERRIQLLRLLQGAALFLTLGLVFFTMYKLLTDVVRPLWELMHMADRARRGDFSLRVAHGGGDELGLLGRAFNLMAEDLSQLYGELEQRVEDKTAELVRSNRSLQLLYHSARRLGQQDGDDFKALLAEAEQVVGLGTLSLCLTTENAAHAYCRITTANGRPPGCRAPACAACLGQAESDDVHTVRPGLLSLPVRESGQRFGVVLLQHPPQQPPEPWQIDLLQAVASHIATALSLGRQREQQHRIALMEERATIARELHDSLAQALSYLKIQISRLQSLIDRGGEPQALTKIVSELREGLNAAYRQLRELLGTFRLKVEAPGLEPALQNTVAEFSRRSNLHILLDYRLGHCPLRPNEEVHILQIVREALANVLHHAQARQAEVQLRVSGRDGVEVAVRDDGIGLPEQWQRTHHYGLTIMQERAEQLGGTLTLRCRRSGGTEVMLRFRPEFARSGGNTPTLASL